MNRIDAATIASVKPREPLPTYYLDISKLINNNHYSLINIPDISALRSPFELGLLTDQSAGPIKTPFGFEVGRGMFSINWMITNYGTIPFEFERWQDTIEVAELLEAYMEKILSKINDEGMEFSDAEKTYFAQGAQFLAEISKVAKKMVLYHHLDNKNVSIFDAKRLETFETALKKSMMPTKGKVSGQVKPGKKVMINTMSAGKPRV